jgi:hypothetical protein
VHTLLTAISGFLALLSTALAWWCYQQAQRANDAQIGCARIGGKLNSMAGRVIALEGALETLQSQHRRLSGQFHAAKNSDTSVAPSGKVEPADVRKPAPVCENYQLAQLGGPLCAAASCDCDYCVEMRGRRALTKAELLPSARAATLAVSRTRE